MKKMMLGAALCGAAVVSAGAANADADDDFLFGSTHALILGSTGIPTPDAAYMAGAESLYLDPSGYDGTTATTLPLTTPETFDFIPSVTQGEDILIKAIETDYASGAMDCNTAGVCSDPLTIFGYSQSSAIAALAEQQLSADGVPTDALRFVLTGASPLGVPDSLYPTEVYDIYGDFFALPGLLGTNIQDVEYELLLHLAYLYVTPAEVDAAIPIVDGMTTFFGMPTLGLDGLFEALLNAINVGF